MHWPGYSHTQEIIYAGRPNQDYVSYGGWRWTGLDIPAGATITEAYVELNQNGWGWTVETTLALENSSDPETFTRENSPAERWSNTTQNKVDWTWNRQKPGQWDVTPDLKQALQELVDNHGDIDSVVLIENGALAPNAKSHSWTTFDKDSGLGAKLHIKYTIDVEQEPPASRRMIWAQVDDSRDDAFDVPDGEFWPGYSHTQHIIFAGSLSNGLESYGGWRWEGLEIPSDARIIEAYVELNQKDWGYRVETDLAFENSPDPEAFSELNTPADRWSNRTDTQYGWSWHRQDPHDWDRTPDLSEALQELVNRYGGVNAVALLESGADTELKKYHTWTAFDYDPAYAAKLYVIYETGPGQPTPVATPTITPPTATPILSPIVVAPQNPTPMAAPSPTAALLMASTRAIPTPTLIPDLPIPTPARLATTGPIGLARRLPRFESIDGSSA